MVSDVRVLRLLLTLAAVVSTTPAKALDVEVEPNNTFAEAQVLPAGSTGVSGALAVMPFDPLDPAATIVSDTLMMGGVNSHDFAGLPAGATFFAYIDNLVGAATPPDTTMQFLDASFVPVTDDDDNSPLGDGFASGIQHVVNADGSVHLRVSGFDDLDFDGLSDVDGTPHPQEGDYDLYLQLGPFGDIDFYTFTDLIPGSVFEAETVAGAPPDTLIALFDDAGALIDFNDDGGLGILSRITGTVPASGKVHLAVTAFPDFPLAGAHLDSGSYELAFGIVVIPEPTSLGLVTWGVLGALCVGRRLRRSKPRRRSRAG